MTIQVQTLSEFIKKECEEIQNEMKTTVESAEDISSKRFDAHIYETCTKIINHNGDRMAFLRYKIAEEEQSLREWLKEHSKEDTEIFRFSTWVGIGARVAGKLLDMKEGCC